MSTKPYHKGPHLLDFLNPSRNGGLTPVLGSLFQWPTTLSGKIFFLNIQPEFFLVQFEAVSPWPISNFLGEEANPSLQGVVESPPEPFFPQIKKPQLPHLLLIGLTSQTFLQVLSHSCSEELKTEHGARGLASSLPSIWGWWLLWYCGQKISGSMKDEIFLHFVYPGSLHCTVENTQCYKFPEREGKKGRRRPWSHLPITLCLSKCQPQDKRNHRSEQEMQRNLTHTCEGRGKKTFRFGQQKEKNFVKASEADNTFHMLLPPFHKEINPTEWRLYPQWNLDGGDSSYIYDCVLGCAKNGENLNKI